MSDHDHYMQNLLELLLFVFGAAVGLMFGVFMVAGRWCV